MGAGFSRINDLTVIQSTQVPLHSLLYSVVSTTLTCDKSVHVFCVPVPGQGLHSYLSRCFPDLDDRGVVIGFDTRGQEESGCSSQR